MACDCQTVAGINVLLVGIGGGCILVREHDVARASEIFAAFEHGALALADDADVGRPMSE